MVDTFRMPLLERELPLAALAEYAKEARLGAGRLVLIAGEAGVGKSTLIEQFEDELPDAHFSWGACDGLFIPRPLGPLFDLAGQLGGDLLDLCRADASREALFTALLRQIDQPGTLNVVVVEDIHWADEATLDLLRFLGRRLHRAAVLLVCTYRDDALPTTHPLRLVLGELAVQRSTRRIGLTPLSAEAVGLLASGSDLDATQLHRLTGGNPFYVTAALQARTGEVPASARDAVLARVAMLRNESRQVLDVAALIGTRIEVPLLEMVTTCPPSVIDELLASGLLQEEGRSLRFRHEIGRLAVDQAIGSHRRVPAHARILQALAVTGSTDDVRMAFHAEEAGNDAAVLKHAVAAARRASELASHRESAAQYERALRFSNNAGDVTSAALCDELADELSLVDRLDEAAATLERALELWRSARHRLREGDTMRRLSLALARLCRGQESMAAGESALAILQPLGPTVELAWAYANLANRFMVVNQHAAAIDMAHRAQTIAEPLGLLDVLSDALNTEACVAATTGQEWTRPLSTALDIALTARLDEQAGRAYANFYANYCEQRLFAEAERYFVDGIAHCQEHEIHTFATCLQVERAGMLERSGRWDEAGAVLTELLDQVAASPGNRLCALMRLGTIRARRAEPGVWACLDEAADLADGTGEPQMIVPVRLSRAEACWLEDKQSSAEREVELAVTASAACNGWQRGALATWSRRLTATRLTATRLPSVDLAEAFRLEIDGDWTGAARIWTDLGCPYDAALALLGATQEAPLREAFAIFQNLGAEAAAKLTRRRMRSLGIRSIPAGARTATRAHPRGLTRREHEVLDLICDGNTNAEIGARLFISAKTVDHHVSAILTKLGAPTRHAAAAEARRLGLVGAA